MDELRALPNIGAVLADELRGIGVTASPAVRAVHLADDGTIPNSPLPLLVYAGALPADAGPAAFEALFARHGWGRSWRNGIYAFRHYHSTAHEVLGIAAGEVQVELGGPAGRTVALTAGDAVLIPAGVSHRNLGDDGLLVVGAYPDGTAEVDLLRDTGADRRAALPNLAALARPASDPVLGGRGGLLTAWPGELPAGR